MQTNGLVGRVRRRFKKTTIADPDALTPAVDLVRRAFGPGTVEINAVWCSDVSYVRTWEGWMYLATVLDVASRRVVGWAMANHMRAELVCDALSMAIERRRPGSGLILHSDRGSQYTSSRFIQLLKRHGVRQSLSRPGQCWDNAVCESFLSTLKCELIHRHAWPTRARARSAIFDYIEGWYNPSAPALVAWLRVTGRLREEVRAPGHLERGSGIVNGVCRIGGTPTRSGVRQPHDMERCNQGLVLSTVLGAPCHPLSCGSNRKPEG